MSMSRQIEKDIIYRPDVVIEDLVAINIYEQLKKLGFEVGTAGVLYGTKSVGKTLITIALAYQLKREKNIEPLFIVTESNWFIKYKGFSIYDIVTSLLGDNSVIAVKEPLELFTIEYPENTLIVIDSLGAIHLRAYKEAYKQLAQIFKAEYKMERRRRERSITLLVAREVIPLINSIVDHIVSEAIIKNRERPSTVIFIAHACREIMGTYRNIADARPSFGSRAGHSLIYEIYVEEPLRLKLVDHRFEHDLIGTEIDLKPLIEDYRKRKTKGQAGTEEVERSEEEASERPSRRRRT